MTVPHLLVETTNSTPLLKEGNKEVHGVEGIDLFLEEYTQLMARWNQDRCDMWFFDEC